MQDLELSDNCTLSLYLALYIYRTKESEKTKTLRVTDEGWNVQKQQSKNEKSWYKTVSLSKAQ